MSFLEMCPQFGGVLIEGFHCISFPVNQEEFMAIMTGET